MLLKERTNPPKEGQREQVATNARKWASPQNVLDRGQKNRI